MPLSSSTRTYSSATTALLFISVAMIALFTWSRFIEGWGKGWKSIISSDGIGYYAYLPSLIIYQDTHWEKFTAAERRNYGRPDYNPLYLSVVGNSPVNKYFAGESILLLPFFLLALAFSFITGSELNGLSFWFQLFTGAGSLCYLLCGLYYLKKILKSFCFSDAVAAMVLGAIIAGTNLL